MIPRPNEMDGLDVGRSSKVELELNGSHYANSIQSTLDIRLRNVRVRREKKKKEIINICVDVARCIGLIERTESNRYQS